MSYTHSFIKILSKKSMADTRAHEVNGQINGNTVLRVKRKTKTYESGGS